MTQAHFLVAKTARALAGTMYEELMGVDAVYAKWKADHPGKNATQLEAIWVAAAWPAMVGAARATLAQMLDTPLSQVLKDQIHDALIKDNIFQESRRAKWQMNHRELTAELMRRQPRMALR